LQNYTDAIRQYIDNIHSKYLGEDTTESTFYSDLENLMRFFFPRSEGYEVIVIPKRTEIGVPDLKIRHQNFLVGYIECKKPYENLDNIMSTEQLQRYSNSFSNLILTDFLDFWKIKDLEAEQKTRITDDIGGTTTPRLTNVDLFIRMIDIFKSFREPEIDSIDILTSRLSKLTMHLKDLIIEDIEIQKSSYNLFLLDEFKKYFVIEPKGKSSVIEFSDLFAQTITYGLFLAWVQFKRDGGDIFQYQVCQNYISKIHPFLYSLFQTIILHQSSHIMELISIIESVLNRIKFPDIFEDVEFEDFILNFYEIFIDAYDKSLKINKGIFYTKFPIVNFIIRGVDYLLREKFEIREGILNKSIKYLDPAAGTLTFLSQLAKLAKLKFEANRQLGLFRGWVRDHFLKNVFAFEIMIAPYTLGHFKINMVLNDLGYKLNQNERIQSFLTNTLYSTIPTSSAQRTLFESVGLADEFKAADKIKRKFPILVIMGNPPYKKMSQNNSQWIKVLMKDYRELVSKKWKKSMISLNDDYVKFIRFAQWKIEQLKEGIITFITNNTFLDGQIFIGMRKILFDVFDDLYIINLNGAMRREIPEDIKNRGITKDESVFDIRLGTCIFFFIKNKKKYKNNEEEKVIKYIDVWGERDNNSNPKDISTKFGWLNTNKLEDINFLEIKPKEPYFLFVPYEFDLQEEYEQFISLDDIFINFQVGVTTARDDLVVGFTEEEVKNKMTLFANQDFSQLKRIGVELKDYKSSKWFYKKVSRDMDANTLKQPVVYTYRGFDKRYIYYDKSIIHRMCDNIMKYMEIPENMAILTTKQLIQPPFNHVFITKDITDIISLSTKSKENAFLFPLLISSREPNIKREFINSIKEEYQIKFSNLNIAKMIFNYIYAILHSKAYRERYEKGLAKDFPLIPFPSNIERIKSISNLGEILISLHLLNSSQIDINRYEVNEGSDIIKSIKYHLEENRVYINNAQYFGNITPEMWEFKIGTIQQIEDWLKRRQGRKLNTDDFNYFLKILDSIRITIEFIKDIDEEYHQEFLNAD